MKKLLLLILISVLSFCGGLYAARFYPQANFAWQKIAALTEAKEIKEDIREEKEIIKEEIKKEKEEKKVKEKEKEKDYQNSNNQNKNILIIVVDDVGADIQRAKQLAAIKLPLTWAIIPDRGYSRASAALADTEGIPYLIHVPMQAITDKSEGDFVVAKGWSKDKIEGRFKPMLEKLPNAIGVNNHRGSEATKHKPEMTAFLEILKTERPGWIFLDSKTIGSSQAYKTAKSMGIAALENNWFLDNYSDRDKVEEAFMSAAKRALRRGPTVAICHIRPETLAFLEKLSKGEVKIPQGVELKTIGEYLNI